MDMEDKLPELIRGGDLEARESSDGEMLSSLAFSSCCAKALRAPSESCRSCFRDMALPLDTEERLRGFGFSPAFLGSLGDEGPSSSSYSSEDESLSAPGFRGFPGFDTDEDLVTEAGSG